MFELFKAGGPAMFGVVGFGLTALVAALLFARSPDPGRLGFIAGMGLATLFMSAAGCAMDLCGVMSVAPRLASSGELSATEVPLLVMKGLAEALSPAIFGFTLLSLVAFACAIGARRRRRTEA